MIFYIVPLALLFANGYFCTSDIGCADSMRAAQGLIRTSGHLLLCNTAAFREVSRGLARQEEPYLTTFGWSIAARRETSSYGRCGKTTSHVRQLQLFEGDCISSQPVAGLQTRVTSTNILLGLLEL